MSLSMYAKVWEHSTHSGTPLVVLLALADHANDNGVAFPSVALLAEKSRTTERNVRLTLDKLVQSGELRVKYNAGPNGKNLYRINLPLKAASPLKSASPLKAASVTPEAGFRLPLKPASPEPSVNRQEPYMADYPPVSSKAADHCPHQEIVAIYHENIPTGRRVKVWNEPRKAKLRARWREDQKRQSLQWWGNFFAYIARSDFLTGKVSTPGRKPFEIDLEWIVTAKNFARIIEGAYENGLGVAA